MPKSYTTRRYGRKHTRFAPYTARGRARYGPYMVRRNRRSAGARTIQRMVRNRRARRTLMLRRKAHAIHRLNRSKSEVLYKNFTIVAPDSFITNGTTVGGLGLVCTDGAGNITEVPELGLLLKDATAANGVTSISPEFTNYLELYKQCKVVHGSVTLLKYSPGLGDGQPSTGTPPTSSVGITGDKNWVSYLHTVIDTGQFRPVDQLLDLAVPAVTNIASIVPNEYFANSNSTFKQLSWDSKKSIKTKVLCARPRDEWTQQSFGVFSNAVPPAAVSQLFCKCPWIDTNTLEQVVKNLLPVGHPNYKSMWALTRLPTITHFGNGFPVRLKTNGGTPADLKVPIFKMIISVTAAFRVPTIRN